MPKRKYQVDQKELKDISRRIKVALTILEVTHKEVEREAKIPTGTLQRYIYGFTFVSGRLLKYFCEKGINPCWILKGEGNVLLKNNK